MQFKSLFVAAALALSVSADGVQLLKPAGNGALDLSSKGLVAVYKRSNGAVHGDQGASGAVGFRSAMDLTQISKPNPQRRQADDAPEAVEWAPNDSVVEEVPMTPAPAPAATAPSSPAASEQGHDQATAPASPAPAAPAPATSVPPAASAPAPAASAPAPASSAPAPAAPAPPASSAPASAPTPTTAAPKPAAPATTAPPAPAVVSEVQTAITGTGTRGPLTFNIINKMTNSISISYQLGTYSPATGGPTTVASQMLQISATTGTFATSTQVVAPIGWAGRMTIGKAGAPLDYRGTKIEGNNGFDGADPNADPDPDVDVSYVDGYSVPATCSCGEVAITGCNKELFDLGNACTNKAGDSEHEVCVNDPRNIHGPASPFFAPCAGSAYTYDYNDVANWQGSCPGNTITCCIGTDCQAPARQPAGSTKREVMALIAARKRALAARVSY